VFLRASPVNYKRLGRVPSPTAGRFHWEPDKHWVEANAYTVTR